MSEQKRNSDEGQPVFKTHRTILIPIELVKDDIKPRFLFRKGSIIYTLH